MNKSKPLLKRMWDMWKKSGAVGSMHDAIALSINAVSHKDLAAFGCSYCGYRSGHSPISGGGSAMWRCGECNRTTVVLGDGIKRSTMGIGLSNNKTVYPKLRKHPRQGIPSHGAKDLRPTNGIGEFFRSRGIGIDSCTCFICSEKNEEHRMMNNICAYVSCKAAGERVVAMFEKGVRLDYREYEPDYVQVKIGACPEHLDQLKALDRLASENGIITKEIIAESRI